ncbi:MAG: antibiotic biosynthesis monooxygenase [Bacteroidota bacterium]
MVLRIWHGYTTKANADIYEHMLTTEIFPEIGDKKIKGHSKSQLLRREMEDEVEFTTIMWFDKLESIKDFVGEDSERAYVPEKAQKVLSRFDARAIHCELRTTLEFDH